jgi:ribosomal protein S18 acetylase RimI-like enzyme
MTMVTEASAADLDALTDLFCGYLAFYAVDRSRGDARTYLAGHLERGSSVLLLARDDDGRAVGFTQLYPTWDSLALAPRFVLYDLFVAPDARRGGVGRALLDAAATNARAAGASTVSLDTAVDNAAAQALYISAGYARDDDFLTFHLELSPS